MQEEMVIGLIGYFNKLTSQRLKTIDSNINMIKKGLNVLSEYELKEEIEKAVKEDEENRDLLTCISNILMKKAQEKVKEKTEAVKSLSVLERAVVEMIARSESDTLKDEIIKELRHTCDSFLIENYGRITRNFDYKINDKKVEFDGEVLHRCFDTVLKFVANDEPVFLTGAAGCGKNVLCKQIAKALDLPFYFSNAVTQEYKITGFTDANGIFHETQFYKAFKNGGIFMLDEMDASIPEVLVILNSAIANRYFDFPAPIGYVEAHKDFRVVAAGNTFGLGADYEYVGRNQLDMASLDRFALIEMDYDTNIELNVARGDRELVDFAEMFREASRKAGVRTIVSYRAIGRIAKLKEAIGIEEALKTCLLKNLQKDDIQMIIKEASGSNKYLSTLKRFI